MRKLIYILTSFIIISNSIYSQNSNYGIPVNNSFEKDFKLKLNFELGYGNWNKTIPNGTQDFIVEYYHGLKDGFDIESSAIYYFKNKIGIGITASKFDAYARLNNVYLIDDSTSAVIAFGSLEDDIRISFLGTTLAYYYETKNNRNILQFELTPGYIFYNNTSKWIIYNNKVIGQTFGLNLALAYDFKLNKYFSIGIGYNILIGSLEDVTVNDNSQKLEQLESMTRTNITLGLNIYL